MSTPPHPPPPLQLRRWNSEKVRVPPDRSEVACSLDLLHPPPSFPSREFRLPSPLPPSHLKEEQGEEGKERNDKGLKSLNVERNAKSFLFNLYERGVGNKGREEEDKRSEEGGGGRTVEASFSQGYLSELYTRCEKGRKEGREEKEGEEEEEEEEKVKKEEEIEEDGKDGIVERRKVGGEIDFGGQIIEEKVKVQPESKKEDEKEAKLEGKIAENYHEKIPKNQCNFSKSGGGLSYFRSFEKKFEIKNPILFEKKMESDLALSCPEILSFIEPQKNTKSKKNDFKISKSRKSEKVRFELSSSEEKGEKNGEIATEMEDEKEVKRGEKASSLAAKFREEAEEILKEGARRLERVRSSFTRPPPSSPYPASQGKNFRNALFWGHGKKAEGREGSREELEVKKEEGKEEGKGERWKKFEYLSKRKKSFDKNENRKITSPNTPHSPFVFKYASSPPHPSSSPSPPLYFELLEDFDIFKEAPQISPAAFEMLMTYADSRKKWVKEEII